MGIFGRKKTKSQINRALMLLDELNDYYPYASYTLVRDEIKKVIKCAASDQFGSFDLNK